MVVQLPNHDDGIERPADIEAGVIDDARARHRRERWAGAIVAAIAVGISLWFGLGGGGGGSGAGRRHDRGSAPNRATHRPAQPLAVVTQLRNITEFGLLAPGVGWAVNDGDFYLTRDGGARWDVLTSNAWTAHGGRSVAGLGLAGDLTAEMGPASSPSSRVLAMGFINTRISAPCEQPLTTDAGRTWATHVMPGCHNATSLSFVNARVGYAVSTPSTHDSELYRTVDGGARWRQVGRFPAPMTVSFGTRRDGLAFVTPNTKSAAGVLYRTTDGGRTWQRSRICGGTPDPTFTVYCGVPTSFGSHGVVLAIAQNLKAHADRAFLYSTADGGRRWTRHGVPPLDSPQVPVLSAPNAEDMFVYSQNGVLHTSKNGGRDWVSIPKPQFKGLYEMQFISADYGWLLGPHGFYSTIDGGRSWRSLGS
jgi:photosystem II stability/assembly factor-like uncharacterized protein